MTNEIDEKLLIEFPKIEHFSHDEYTVVQLMLSVAHVIDSVGLKIVNE